MKKLSENDNLACEFIANFLSDDDILLLIIIMDMSVTCSSCGKKLQDYPTYCYMCDDYFCSDQCHMNKHNKQWQKF